MKTSSPILITGAAGLAGYWLTQALKQRGFQNIVLTDIRNPENLPNIVLGSINDEKFIFNLLKTSKPELIFHLAGIVGNREPELLEQVNVQGTDYLLKNLVELNLMDTRVLLVSSSAVYGDHGKEKISENMELKPTSPYSYSKVKQEQLGHHYFQEHSLPVIISRTFNNFAPREEAHMFISRIASQIVEIETGQKNKLTIGPMFSYRDYIDTRDAVNAYIDLGLKGIPGEVYNVCSGKALQIQELFNQLLACSNRNIPYEIIEYDQRGNIPFQVGNPEKLHSLSGWKTYFSLNSTLEEIIQYWRDKK